MGRKPNEGYRMISENDELKRRVVILENRMDQLQKDNEEMRKVLTSKFGLLKLSILNDKAEEEQRMSRARVNTIMSDQIRRRLRF